MSITTIYKCDKCGNEQDNGKQFWHVRRVRNEIRDDYFTCCSYQYRNYNIDNIGCYTFYS